MAASAAAPGRYIPKRRTVVMAARTRLPLLTRLRAAILQRKLNIVGQHSQRSLDNSQTCTCVDNASAHVRFVLHPISCFKGPRVCLPMSKGMPPWDPRCVANSRQMDCLAHDALYSSVALQVSLLRSELRRARDPLTVIRPVGSSSTG